MKLASVVALAMAMAVASQALAVLTNVTYEDGRQDPLWVPSLVDELGNGSGFIDTNEWIDAWSAATNIISCQQNYGTGNYQNVIVGIWNRTTHDYTHVWYVADPNDTVITNDDGTVNGGLAFEIDSAGVNRPLVSETMANDGIWQSGEQWEFVVQEYQHFMGLAAHMFKTVGVGSPSGQGDTSSGGSIIAWYAGIPEPATLSLLAIGGLALLRRPRRLRPGT